MSPLGIEQPCVESRLITEEQEPFGIGIESANSIDSGRKMKFRQRPVGRSVRRELAENAVRFVKGQDHTPMFRERRSRYFRKASSRAPQTSSSQKGISAKVRAILISGEVPGKCFSARAKRRLTPP